MQNSKHFLTHAGSPWPRPHPRLRKRKSGSAIVQRLNRAVLIQAQIKFKYRVVQLPVCNPTELTSSKTCYKVRNCLHSRHVSMLTQKNVTHSFRRRRSWASCFYPAPQLHPTGSQYTYPVGINQNTSSTIIQQIMFNRAGTD